MTQTGAYGSWKSPITADLIASSTVRLGQMTYDGPNLYWLESRPSEGGRYVIVRHTLNGKTEDVTPPPFNVRTRVHEYGGGDYLVVDGTVFFSNYQDQRLYRQDPDRSLITITPEAEMRYADGIVDRQRNRIICIREDHTGPGRETINTIVALDPTGQQPAQVLVSGNDFYASPRLSPDGTQLAWLTWNHPNMPWDGTELWVGEIQSGGTRMAATKIAGGDDESIFQPQWSPDGTLYFVSDRTGWWNLYRWEGKEGVPILGFAAEFGLPQWVFGMSTYSIVSSERLVCSYVQNGIWSLASLNLKTGELTPLDTAYTVIEGVQGTSDHVAFIGGSATESDAIVQLDLNTGQTQVLRRSTSLEFNPGYLSEPRAIQFPTDDDQIAHGLFYPPQNVDYQPPDGELPPLLVLSHGGPTGATDAALKLGIQFWTSRGFAVLDVNYRGSTGYGRAYREKLKDQWGVVDVEDCVNGARYLAEQGQVDDERLIIRGGSAGGYTTLSALTFYDVFSAGASHYGVSDLEALAQETHKFESRYLDRLVGPYPERRELYQERSPIHHTDQLSCPVIFFQGLEDQVVPPNQAEAMVQALDEKGLPVAYVPFEEEQHGFRRAENIQRALEAELYFYSRIFGFELAEEIAPVEIKNLKS